MQAGQRGNNLGSDFMKAAFVALVPAPRPPGNTPSF